MQIRHFQAKVKTEDLSNEVEFEITTQSQLIQTRRILDSGQSVTQTEIQQCYFAKIPNEVYSFKSCGNDTNDYSIEIDLKDL